MSRLTDHHAVAPRRRRRPSPASSRLVGSRAAVSVRYRSYTPFSVTPIRPSVSVSLAGWTVVLAVFSTNVPAVMAAVNGLVADGEDVLLSVAIRTWPP